MADSASSAQNGDRFGGHGHAHEHRHDANHSHSHSHLHGHGPEIPHPAQAAPWSILRMSVTARLMAALAVSAALWGAVLLAMRPS